jgi:HTH-type transcriptional regulator, competence development regulator
MLALLDITSTRAIVSETMQRLSHLLADGRKRAGLTLRTVEAKTGISNAYLSQIENGKIKEPSPLVLHKLSQLYRISYATALQAAGYPLPGRTASPSTLAARVGPTSVEEENALVEYLEFLRSKHTKER